MKKSLLFFVLIFCAACIYSQTSWFIAGNAGTTTSNFIGTTDNVPLTFRVNKEKQVYSGFIAQEVEEAARSIGYDFSGVAAPEHETGIYGISYAEFVVPLVKAVQELSEQNDVKDAAIAELKDQVSELKGLVYDLLKTIDIQRSENHESSLIGHTDASIRGAFLFENIPNPFNETTVIRYSLPQACKVAQIIVTNYTGNVIRQIPLSVSDGTTGSLRIEGGSLSSGVYFYSLYVDKRLIDTKKMILSK